MSRGTRIRSLVVAALAILGCSVSGCSQQDDGAVGVEKVDDVGQALTVTQERVLGFETALADWTRTGGGTLSASSNASQGTQALGVVPTSSTVINSRLLSSLGPVGNVLSVDLRMASVPAWGSLRAHLVVPSKSINSDLGAVNLGEISSGSYQRLSFTIPTAVRQSLSTTTYSDLTVRFTFSAPALAQPYLLDAVGFSDATVPGVGYFSVALPQGIDLNTAFMTTTSRLRIYSQVTAGVSGQSPVFASFGSGTTFLESQAKAHGNLFSVPTVDLKSKTVVGGFIRTSGTVLMEGVGTGDAPVTGPRFTGVPVPSSTVDWNVTWPAVATVDYNLAPVVTPVDYTVAPGAYGIFRIGDRNRMHLTAGTYYFDSFTTEPLAEIHVDKTNGPVFIYVRTGFTYRGKFVHVAGDPNALFVGYLGNTTAVLQAPYVGGFVAPNGTIRLDRPTTGQHKGSFYGRAIDAVSGPHTILHVPFGYWDDILNPEVPCALGDTDGDGTDDCTDECRTDPDKIFAGVCGCFKPETDSESDHIPNCREGVGCNFDGTHAKPGQCGGCYVNDAPAGTPCTDSVCAGNTTSIPQSATCDGQGNCGDPSECQPAPNCELTLDKDAAYWRCPDPVTYDDAKENCEALEGRRLVQIDSRVENALIASFIDSESWTGATDTVEGEWRWTNPDGSAGPVFWVNGERVDPGAFEAWGNFQPSFADCGTISPDDGGPWAARDCTTLLPYICEQRSPENPAEPPPPSCPPGMPPGSCDQPPPQSATCTPPEALQEDLDEALEDIEACEAAWTANGCTEANHAACDAACNGIAKLPAAGARCPSVPSNEVGFCALENVVEAGCTPGADCCAWTEALDAAPRRFDANAESLTYADNGFRGATQPNYASGQYVTTGGNAGGALRVQVGGVDNNTINTMSGGWALSINLAAPSLVSVEFDYNLTQTGTYETDELSEVLLSVDGTLYGGVAGDYVDRITGDGNTGPALSTGWRVFSKGIGTLPAGAHTIRIGAYNNRKTNADESTTLLVDNLRVSGSSNDCAAGFTCGMVFPADCHRCAEGEVDCVEDCPGALRCGTPLVTQDGDTEVFCANDAAFGNDWCDVSEVCADPEAFGTSNPLTDPRSSLDEPVLDADEAFGTPAEPEPEYVSDPACASPPCTERETHRWCNYNVNTWDDPALAAEEIADPTPARNTPVDSQQGTSGGGLVSFTFDPGVALDYEANPMPFGESELFLDASASVLAEVMFNLPLVGEKAVRILDANLAVHADRCHAKSTDSHLLIFGQDYLPTAVLFDSSTIFEPSLCTQEVQKFREAINRAKKAYRDALELIRLYEQYKQDVQSFPADFCESIMEDAPAGFSTAPCNGESPAATINRFIAYYQAQVTEQLTPALDILREFQIGINPDVPLIANKETQTIVEATFPLGPIPLRLEVEAFAEYGLTAGFEFNVTPGALLATSGEVETLAYIGANARPYATAGVALFVGVGFGVPGFSVSAGVEGAITLGRLSLNNYAGAGIGIQALKDDRDFPPDIAAAAADGVEENKVTLFPPGGVPTDYRFSLMYKYGSDVRVDDIMRGRVSARLRLKVLFFSKTWRKVLFDLPGFGGITIPLLRGGDGVDVDASLDKLWGTVQMPLPFVSLKPLDINELLPGPETPIDTSNVNEFFFDGLCECVDVGTDCTRDAHCCDNPDVVCFSDPLAPADPTCQTCRGGRQTCNSDNDCCNPDASCQDWGYDDYPAGVKACGCEPVGNECNVLANCCQSADEVEGELARFCDDDPNDAKANTPVCRECHNYGERCNTTADCCDTGSIKHCSDIVGDDTSDTVCHYSDIQ